jgi:CD109 antigen
LKYVLEAKYDSFEEIRNLHRNIKKMSAFIQTDKSTYKPSDTVRFRIIIVNSDTKPVENPNIQNIFITDGSDNRVKQYENPKFHRGVFETSFQLSDLPVFGNWKIHVQINDSDTTKEFEVTEYVLPKFKLFVEGSNDVNYNFEKILITIRAQYTYGKPVKGKAEMNINVATTYHEFKTIGRTDSTVKKNFTVDGKAVVEIDIPKELNIVDNKYNRILLIEVKFTEDLTGKEVTEKHFVRIHNTLYKFDLIKSRERFKPKLPFHCTAIVRNHDRNTPVTDSFEAVKFSLTYYYYESTKYKSRDSPPRELSETKNHTILLENGMARIDLDVDKKYTRFHIKV